MAKEAIKVQEGNTLDYTAASTIANGDVIAFSAGRIGVARDDAIADGVIAVAVTGVWAIDCTTADVVAFGDKLYFDSTTRKLTTTVGSNTEAGMAVTAKAAAAAGTVNVLIG